MPKPDIYQIVTDQILDALDKDILPWRKPWSVRNGGDSLHKNLISKRSYRGINPFLLELAAITHGWTSPYWITYKKAKEKGGQVRKGEHGTLVVFWKILNKKVEEDGEEKVKSIPLLRYYNVFNVEQIDGVEAPVVEQPEETEPFSPLDAAEAVLAGMPNAPTIGYGGGRAFYSPLDDHIQLPDRSAFHSPDAYYATDFHERVHSTGHEDRLARKDAFGHEFGTASYAKEELVAEMGASLLCARCGIDLQTNQVSYLRNWLSAGAYKQSLRDDKKLIVNAAAQAQRACDFILGENVA